ncbi:Uncharacterised protein [BD1-7 clade bacterium]|uniref:Uncharacterized protein n=1 Tax=BD1-7 clade bacterium TaxID=2029982 RepID=A0A5S9Q7J1_9GAMM|nr:Uncharacterised protein [BD1-7 clade bacterium]CAA0113106.1 Uncharacterised protein [BD1-7 clade bacterium]
MLSELVEYGIQASCELIVAMVDGGSSFVVVHCVSIAALKLPSCP